jgi:hypothetical protein
MKVTLAFDVLLRSPDLFLLINHPSNFNNKLQIKNGILVNSSFGVKQKTRAQQYGQRNQPLIMSTFRTRIPLRVHHYHISDLIVLIISQKRFGPYPQPMGRLVGCVPDLERCCSSGMSEGLSVGNY